MQPYLLYLIEATHVAALTAVIEDGETLENQFGYGTSQVRANFASVSVLFVIDRAIKRLLKQLNRLIDAMVNTATSSVPGSSGSKQSNAIEGIAQIVKLALNITIGYVDKAVMSHIFRSDHENNWKPAKDGVVLYAKTWKPILLSASIVATIAYGPFVLAAVFHEELLAALGGQDAVVSQLEAFAGGVSDVGLILLVTGILALLFVVHFGIVKSWLTALVLTIFLNETESETPDGEWEQKLRENSDEFRAFERRAEEGGDAPGTTGTWRDRFLPTTDREDASTT
ncbi:hypothetical protein OB905_09420 [Halobacteria archaeon AArc-dxtr1]|nr:hypothetical protein [Halobacteria archaeon AArc-dxtr1]